MNTCETYEPLIISAVLGELDENERAALDEHLETCGSCREAYREFQTTLQMADDRRRPAPTEQVWTRVYAPLEEKIGRRRSRAPQPKQAARAVFEWLEGLWQPRWAYRFAIALLLISAGITIDRVWLHSEADPVPTASVEETTTPVREARAYIDRSKLLLLGVVNMETGEPGAFPLDLSHQQALASKLAGRADRLEEQLSAQRHEELRALVEQLELILLQIANLEATADTDAIELVQTGIDQRNLLLKIRLEELRHDESPGEKPRTSRNTNL